MVSASHDVASTLPALVGYCEIGLHGAGPWALRQLRGRAGGNGGIQRPDHGDALHSIADVRPAAQAERQVCRPVLPIGLLNRDDRQLREFQVPTRLPVQDDAGHAAGGADAARDHRRNRHDRLPVHGPLSPWDQTMVAGCGEG